MPKNYKCLNLFLPNHWNRHIKSALLHVISLARLACVHTWEWAAGSLDTRTRLTAQLQQARAEIALLREELRRLGLVRLAACCHGAPDRLQQLEDLRLLHFQFGAVEGEKVVHAEVCLAHLGEELLLVGEGVMPLALAGDGEVTLPHFMYQRE